MSSEIDRMVGDKAEYDGMVRNTKAFSKPNASMTIAQEIVDIALSHEE